MMKLVAVGNRFMKDDGIAIAVAESLENRLSHLGLRILIGETDCQSSYYLLNRDDFVFILDALYMGAEPGSVHVLNLEEVMSQPSDSFMQHDMSMIELMKLYGDHLRGYMIGIEVAEIGFGDELSPVLRDKLPQICLEIENSIKKIILEEKAYA